MLYHTNPWGFQDINMFVCSYQCGAIPSRLWGEKKPFSMNSEDNTNIIYSLFSYKYHKDVNLIFIMDNHLSWNYFNVF
jgi:hypothetical protein